MHASSCFWRLGDLLIFSAAGDLPRLSASCLVERLEPAAAKYMLPFQDGRVQFICTRGSNFIENFLREGLIIIIRLTAMMSSKADATMVPKAGKLDQLDEMIEVDKLHEALAEIENIPNEERSIILSRCERWPRST